MSILETIAIYVVIPGAIFALAAVLTVVPGRAKSRPRYRPGQPWEYPDRLLAGDLPVVRTGTALDSTALTLGGARGNW